MARRERSQGRGDDTAAVPLICASWQALVDSLPDPIILLAPVRDDAGVVVDFRYRMANDAACAFHHLPPGGLLDASLLDLHPASIETGLMAGYVELLARGVPIVARGRASAAQAQGGGHRLTPHATLPLSRRAGHPLRILRVPQDR